MVSPKEKQDKRRVLLVGFLTLFFAVWVAVNVEKKATGAGGIFALLLGAALFTIINEERIAEAVGAVGNGFSEGIESLEMSLPDALVGAGVAAVLIGFSKINEGFSLFVPTIPAAAFEATFLSGTVGQAIIIIALAPIVEEIAFRGALKRIILERLGGLSEGGANLAQAAIFAVYHVIAYAGVLRIESALAQSGAFITAGIVGLILGIVVDKRKNLLPAIIIHAMFNGFIWTALAVVLG